MIKKIDEKEAEDVKMIYNHNLDKRSYIMKNTQFKVEDFSGDVIGKDFFSPEQLAKLNNFFSENNVSIKTNIGFIFSKSIKKNKIDLQTSSPPPPE